MSAHRLVDCCYETVARSPVYGSLMTREAFDRSCERLAEELGAGALNGERSLAPALALLEQRGLPNAAAMLRELCATQRLAPQMAPRESALLVASALELRQRLEREKEYIEACLGSSPSKEAFFAELSLILEELNGIPISYETLGQYTWPGEALDYLTGKILLDTVARSMSHPVLEEKKLLVIGSGDVDHRGYILESLAQARCSLVLATSAVPTWENRYIKDHILCSFEDTAATLARVQAYHQGNPFDGLLCYIEPYLEIASQIGHSLGLRCLSSQAVGAVRDKGIARGILKEHGLRSPKVVFVSSPALELPPGFRFPAVLKPRKGHSSINVVKVEDRGDFDRVWAALHQEDTKSESDWHIEGSYLLEEFISGKEFSVESVVSEGHITHVAITEKFKGPEPFFEEVGHCVPAQLLPELSGEIHRTVSAAVEALGIKSSVVHTEVIIDPAGGEATIVEVNSRLGGDKIPFLVKLATGFDMSQAAALAALGEAIPRAPEGRAEVAAICAFVPSKPGVIKATPQLPDGVGEVVEFHFWAEVGREVAPPPKQFFSRLGFVVVKGKHRGEIALAVSKLVAEISSQIGVELIVPAF